MATFSENSNWVDVTKPFNTDYHIAEKTNIIFSGSHPFIVGDYITETSSGATGILYENISTSQINIARDSSTLFPSSGQLINGTETFSYISSSVTHGIDNDVTQRLVDRTKWLNDNKTNKTTTITAGNGLTGGGDLSTNRIVTLGTPSTITSSSVNESTSLSHTHEIDKANTTRKGVVQLNNTLTSSSVDDALTAAQGKILQDNKANNSITITAGNGLTGGGNLTANRTISLGTPSSCSGSTSNAASGTTHTHTISQATESVPGVGLIATLADVLAGTSTTKLLTPYNVGSQKNLATNGWYKLPGGLIVQWGQVNLNFTNYLRTHTFNFPISFTTSVLRSFISLSTTQLVNTSMNCSIKSISTSQFNAYTYSNNTFTTTCDWFAIGY